MIHELNNITLVTNDTPFTMGGYRTGHESDDIPNLLFCSWEIPNLNNMYEDGTTSPYSSATPENSPLTFGSRFEHADNGNGLTAFGNTVLVYRVSNNENYIIDSMNADLQNLVWFPAVVTDTYTDTSGATATRYTLSLSNQRAVHLYDANRTDIGTVPIFPYHVALGSTTHLSAPYTSTYEVNVWGNSVQRENGDLNTGHGVNYTPTFDSFQYAHENNQTKISYSADENYFLWSSWSSKNYAKCTEQVYIATESELLYHLATYGMKFEYNGTLYKPVIEGGCVVGYTDDMTSRSEWDDWHNRGDHVNATERPKHGTDTDGIEDMPLEFTSYGTGAVTYYIVSKPQLENIITSISDQLTYPDLINNVVSVKSYACDISEFYSGASDTVKVGKFDTGVSATKINTLSLAKQIASFSVKGKYGTAGKPHFLDYSPYTKLEMYIPYCGTVEIPSTAMYNTVQVYIVSDITSGSCVGVVKCNGDIIAQKSGMIGTQVPLTMVDSASQNNAMLQGVLNSVAISSGVLLAGATNNVAGMVSGTMAGVSNIGQQIAAGNMNYTRTVGTTGDKSIYAMPRSCYLKRYRAIDMSDESYDRTYGRPCCKTKTLSSGMGYTIVDNPRISGGMTETEKNEIIAMLKTGVIL